MSWWGGVMGSAGLDWCHLPRPSSWFQGAPLRKSTSQPRMLKLKTSSQGNAGSNCFWKAPSCVAKVHVHFHVGGIIDCTYPAHMTRGVRSEEHSAKPSLSEIAQAMYEGATEQLKSYGSLHVTRGKREDMFLRMLRCAGDCCLLFVSFASSGIYTVICKSKDPNHLATCRTGLESDFLSHQRLSSSQEGFASGAPDAGAQRSSLLAGAAQKSSSVSKGDAKKMDCVSVWCPSKTQAHTLQKHTHVLFELVGAYSGSSGAGRVLPSGGEHMAGAEDVALRFVVDSDIPPD